MITCIFRGPCWRFREEDDAEAQSHTLIGLSIHLILIRRRIYPSYWVTTQLQRQYRCYFDASPRRPPFQLFCRHLPAVAFLSSRFDWLYFHAITLFRWLPPTSRQFRNTVPSFWFILTFCIFKVRRRCRAMGYRPKLTAFPAAAP